MLDPTKFQENVSKINNNLSNAIELSDSELEFIDLLKNCVDNSKKLSKEQLYNILSYLIKNKNTDLIVFVNMIIKL
jgi:hypothetical protein